MKRSEICEFIFETIDNIVGLGGSKEERLDLYTDVGTDSLDRIEIVTKIEKKYNISIPDDVAEKFCIVQDLVDETIGRLEAQGLIVEQDDLYGNLKQKALKRQNKSDCFLKLKLVDGSILYFKKTNGTFQQIEESNLSREIISSSEWCSAGNVFSIEVEKKS